MNLPTCKSLFLATFLLLINSIPQLHAAANSHPADSPGIQSLTNQEIHTLIQTTYEAYYTRLLAHMHMLACMLQDLAFNVSNNNGIASRNKATIIKELSDTRELLTSLQKIQIVVLDDNIINSLITVNREIVINLTESLKKGMTGFKAIDMRKIGLGTKNRISPEHFEAELFKNEKLIKELEPLANNLGLRWYNKLYRKFKRTIVEPAKAAYIPALCATSVGTAAFFAWYYFGGNKPEWLRKKVGWPGIQASSSMINDPNTKGLKARLQLISEMAVQKAMQEGASKEEIDSLIYAAAKDVERPAGWLASIENTLQGLSVGQYIIGSTLMTVGLSQANKLMGPFKEWAGKKLKAADNFLLGGAYKNRQVDEFSWRTDVTFDDVIGNEDAKQYGRELCQYLKNPESFDRSKIAPSTGILLFGETRTGKSHFILALQGEIQRTLGDEASRFKVWKISFQDLLKINIQDLLDAARGFAPCIVVIEEIDLLGLQRVGNAERLASFMTAMSSCLQDNTLDKTVIIIATTNKLENLEPALRQPGRFGKHIFFKYPSCDERKLYITRELAKTGCSINDFDIDKLAAETEGCSFEKLSLFIKRTFLHAKLYGRLVTQETLEQSIDENVRGISHDVISMSPEQQKIVAAHLAGHVIASMFLEAQTHIAKITLKDVAGNIEESHAWIEIMNKNKDKKQAALEHGKIFLARTCDIGEIESRAEKIKQCKIALAGHVAEKIMLGTCGYSYHAQDKQLALDIAKSLTLEGIDPTSLSEADREKRLHTAHELLNSCEQEITKLLAEHHKELTAAMNALIENENKTLDAHQLNMIVFGFDKSAPKPLDSTKMLEELLKCGNPGQPTIEVKDADRNINCTRTEIATR